MQIRTKERNSKMEEQYEREKMGGCGGSCLAAILVVCLFIVGILWFFQASVNTDNTDIPSLLSRKASMQDIYIDCHLDSLAAVALTVKPEHDIENLVIIRIFGISRNSQKNALFLSAKRNLFLWFFVSLLCRECHLPR